MTTSSGDARESSSNYRPDVDGLRALAVLAVMLYHAGLGCDGGYVGVDVFFVISGFLIASLILRELGRGEFSFVGFWERRVRRIVPALTVVILATLAAGWFLFLPLDFEHLGKSVAAQASLISNVVFSRDTDYFAAGSDAKPLLHTWSLAVEEQFYLLFPLLLIFLARYRKTSLAWIIACLAVGSFALCVVESHTSPQAAFYLLPARTWELLTGAWLAATRGRLIAGARVRETAGWLGIGLVCSAVFCFDRDTRYPGMAALAPCLGAALIIFSSEASLSRVGRILALKPVVFIGLISYSLYLWHWPLLVFSKYPAREAPGVGVRIGLLAASVVLAAFSWRFVETPVRQRRVFRKRRLAFFWGGASLATLLWLGLFVYSHDGFRPRFPAKVLYYANSRSDHAFLFVISLERALAGQFIELGSQDTNRPIQVLIWGDSHAMALTPVLNDLCNQSSRRGIEATQISTPPVLGYVGRGTYGLKQDSPLFAGAVLRFIAQNHVKNVVIAARWSGYPPADSLETNLLATVRAVMDLGARVYVVKDVPRPGFDVPRIVALTAARHGNIDLLGVTPEQYQQLNGGFRRSFERISQMGATVLDPAPYLLNHDGLYGVVRNDKVLYWDSHHLSVEGSKLLAPMFEPLFRVE